MITIRHADRGDIAALQAMHASQKLDYQLPDFDRPDWVVRAVLEETPGQPQMAILLRRTCEEYLLIGPDAGNGKDRIGKILALQREVATKAAARGYRDLHVWVPPSVEKNFGRHLSQLGWQRPLWTDYFRDL